MTAMTKTSGPTGFLQLGSAHFLSVLDGKVIHPSDDGEIGFLFDDGLLMGLREPLGVWDGLKTIEELPGAAFQGIDALKVPMQLPGPERGPIGGLKYNGRELMVLFGRIATLDHKLIGRMSDDGTLYFRDPRFPDTYRKMDETCQLATVFQGTKSNGQAWKQEFQRSLHLPDKSYWENEVMRYFVDYDRINQAQRKYVLDTMKLFALSGLLQLVRKSEGTAGLGNVKHGAAGVTGVRTGNVTLFKDDFEKEVNFYKRFGALMVIPFTRLKPFVEVRINLVVAHEYGHQLEFCLAQASQQRIQDIYEERLQKAAKLHPIPDEAGTVSEIVEPHEIEKRTFVSGYARSSWHEYWAECVAAFAVRESRDELRNRDPQIYELLCDVVLQPEKVLSPRLQESMLSLQTSLRAGGELPDEILKVC